MTVITVNGLTERGDLEICKKFCESIYTRVAELVLGSTPAATPGVVDGAARGRRPRQLAG
jgi:hypothetical protein